jgi:hypothetical protein
MMTPRVLECAVEHCTDFNTLLQLKLKNESLAVTENVLIAAAKNRYWDDLLAWLLEEFKVEETIVTSRVLESTIENTQYPENIKRLLEFNPRLAFTPANLKALIGHWSSRKHYITPEIWTYLQERDDVQVSKDKLLQEALENGTRGEILNWLTKMSHILECWKKDPWTGSVWYMWDDDES